MGSTHSRHQHLVDDVDDAVGLKYIADGDVRRVALRIGNGPLITILSNRNNFALDGLELSFAAARGDLGSEIIRAQASGNHVIGKNFDQCSFVFGLQ